MAEGTITHVFRCSSLNPSTCDVPAKVFCISHPTETLYFCEDHLISHLEDGEEHQVEYCPNTEHQARANHDLSVLETLNIKARGHSRPITCILIADTYLFAGENNGVHVWDISSNRPGFFKHIPTEFQVYSMAASVQGNYLAVGTEDGDLFIYYLSTLDLIHSIKLENSSILALNITKNSEFILVGLDRSRKNFKVFSLKSWDFVFSSDDEQKLILCVESSIDSNFGFSGSKDYSIVKWDLTEKKLLMCFYHKNPVTSLCCISDKLISGALDGVLMVSSLKLDENNSENKEVSIVYPEKSIYSIVAVPESQNFIVAFDDKIDYEKKNPFNSSDKASNSSIGLYKLENTSENESIKLMQEINSNELISGLAVNTRRDKVFGIYGGRIIISYILKNNGEEISGKDFKKIGFGNLVIAKMSNDPQFLVCGYDDGSIALFDVVDRSENSNFESVLAAKEELGKEYNIEFI